MLLPFLFYLYRHVRLSRKLYTEFTAEYPSVLHIHIPGIDHLYAERCGIIKMELPERRTHEAVVKQIILFNRLPFSIRFLRYCTYLIPAPWIRHQAASRCFAHDLMKQAKTLIAFPVKLTAMGPPQNILRIHVGFPMSGISPPAGSLPETPEHLLSADISPTMLDVTFIGDFIHHNGLAELLSPFVDQLRRFIQVYPLDAAMGNPGPAVIIHSHAVMDGTQMMVGILFHKDGAVAFPVLLRFAFHQIKFIGQGPPDITIGRKSGDYIFPVKIVLIFIHDGKAPPVIGMHHDDISYGTGRPSRGQSC